MHISFLIAVFETTMGMKTVLWYYTLTNRFKHQITHGSFAQAFICIIIVETTIFLSERSIYKLKYSMQMSDLSSVMSMLSNRSRQYCIHFVFIKNIVEKIVHCIKLFLKRKRTLVLLMVKMKCWECAAYRLSCNNYKHWQRIYISDSTR
jgi:hypothetical protein